MCRIGKFREKVNQKLTAIVVGRGGRRALLLNGKFAVIKKVLQTDNGGGHITFWMHTMSLN